MDPKDIKTREYLIGKFIAGAKPVQEDFAALINSAMNQIEDGIDITPGTSIDFSYPVTLDSSGNDEDTVLDVTGGVQIDGPLELSPLGELEASVLKASGDEGLLLDAGTGSVEIKGQTVGVEGDVYISKNETNPTVSNTLDVSHGERGVGTHPTDRALYVSGVKGGTEGAEFRSADGQIGVGLSYDTIYTTGSGQDLNIIAGGNQKLVIQADTSLDGNLVLTEGKKLVLETSVNGGNNGEIALESGAIELSGVPVEISGSNPITLDGESGEITAQQLNYLGDLEAKANLHVGGRITAEKRMGVGVEEPAACAALEIKSTTGGLLLPRMEDAQIGSISTAEDGLLAYGTDSHKLRVFTKGVWGTVQTVAPIIGESDENGLITYVNYTDFTYTILSTYHPRPERTLGDINANKTTLLGEFRAANPGADWRLLSYDGGGILGNAISKTSLVQLITDEGEFSIGWSYVFKILNGELIQEWTGGSGTYDLRYVATVTF